MIVRCAVCFREERWEEGTSVLQPGGSRHPQLAAPRQAFETLVAAHQQGQAALGRCVCSQPLIGTPSSVHPPIPWEVPIGNQMLTIAPDGLAMGGTPCSIEEATKTVESTYPSRGPFKPAHLAFYSVLWTTMLAPVFLWMAAVSVVVMFLIAFGTRPGFG